MSEKEYEVRCTLGSTGRRQTRHGMERRVV